MSAADPALEPLRTSRPAAFRRPGLIVAYVAYLLVAGFALAAPWSAIVHGTVAGYPRGDAELFDRGGIMLLEALRLTRFGAPAAMTSSALVLVLVGAIGLLPFAALIAGLGREGRVRAPFLAARAVRPIGTLTLVWGLSFAAQAVVAALVTVLGVKLVGAFHLAERGEALANLVVAAVVLLALLPIGVARDLALVSAVNDETRFYTSSSRALQVLRRAFARTIGAYLVRSLAALAILLAALCLPSLLRAPDAPPAAAIPFAIHQLALVLAVALRASWLASAIRLLDSRAPQRSVAPALDPPVHVPVEPSPEPLPAVDPREPIAPVEPVAPIEPVAPPPAASDPVD